MAGDSQAQQGGEKNDSLGIREQTILQQKNAKRGKSSQNIKDDSVAVIIAMRLLAVGAESNGLDTQIPPDLDPQ